VAIVSSARDRGQTQDETHRRRDRGTLPTTLTDDEAARLEAPYPLRPDYQGVTDPAVLWKQRPGSNIRRLTLSKQSRPLASLHSDPSVWRHLSFKIVFQGISKSCPDISESQAGHEQVNLTFECGAIIGKHSHAPDAMQVGEDYRHHKSRIELYR